MAPTVPVITIPAVGEPGGLICPEPPGLVGIIFGLAIVFGQFIAFSPQLYSIGKKKHVEGINLLTYLLGTVSCTAVFFSGILESWTAMKCCSVVKPWRCITTLITLAQVGVNWLNYFMIFCMLAIYVKNTEHKPRAKLAFRLSLVVYIAWGVIGGTLITFASVFIAGPPEMEKPSTSWTTVYNKVLGLLGTITIIMQWSPQIITTFLHKGPGALSPITLSINSPGAIITALTIIANHKSFSLWLPYVLSGSQQAVIVALILYFYCRRSKKGPIEEILDTDPGFQGPALLLEDEDASSSDGLTSPGSLYRSRSDSEFPTFSDSEEEMGEEDTEDDDPDRQLLNRKRKIRRARRSQLEATLSRSVPGYESLMPRGNIQ